MTTQEATGVPPNQERLLQGKLKTFNFWLMVRYRIILCKVALSDLFTVGKIMIVAVGWQIMR